MRIEPTAKVKEWAEKADAVQDGCNLAGIVNAFNDVKDEMLDDGISTADLSAHPVIIAFVDKLASLTGTQSTDNLTYAAHTAIAMLLGDKAVEWYPTESTILDIAREAAPVSSAEQ